ncbi:hypothetical protein LXL04_014335 [Taraxacum kok-saghyz]
MSESYLNNTDCGIFLMRHMETYKGQELQDWEVNLEIEDADKGDQQMQLAALRRKYVTKILTSDLNNLKPTVYSYLPKYDALPLEKKLEINTKEHFNRMQARSSYIVLFIHKLHILDPHQPNEENHRIHSPNTAAEFMTVITPGDGLEGSYFAGVVIDRTPGMRKVKYDTLQDDDGNPLEELITIRRLRPPPPKVDARMHSGDLVDAWHNDGWWVGRYMRREGDNYVVVFYKYPNQEYSYARKDLRFHHEWSPVTDRSGKTASCWVLIKK